MEHVLSFDLSAPVVVNFEVDPATARAATRSLKTLANRDLAGSSAAVGRLGRTGLVRERAAIEPVSRPGRAGMHTRTNGTVRLKSDCRGNGYFFAGADASKNIQNRLARLSS